MVKIEKVRYLLVIFVSTETLSEKDAWFIVTAKVRELFGIMGAADMGLYLTYFHEQHQIAIFRCGHQQKYRLAAALSFCTNINGKHLYVIPIETTGTLKKAKKLLLDKKNLNKIKIINQLLLK